MIKKKKGDVVDKKVIKKDMYDKLVKKVNAIQAVNPSNFCQKNLIWQKKQQKKKKKRNWKENYWS